MTFFLISFIFICLLIAGVSIFLMPRKKRKKDFFIYDQMDTERPWSLVDKGPDSTFTEKLDQDK